MIDNDTIESLETTGRWRAREVTYWRGKWDKLSTLVPHFEIREFKAGADLPANPHMKAVVRLPMRQFEQAVPVGVVSNTYSLAQHSEVAQQCFHGIEAAGVKAVDLTCELGLTALGEWMNLAVFFPERFDYKPPDREPLHLRLECFNSVDGSSRLVLLLGWYRFVCANGLVIGKTKVELRDVHDESLDLSRVSRLIVEGLSKVADDRDRLEKWGGTKIEQDRLVPWANKDVSAAWGKKAACRTYHICTTGFDVEFVPPFEQTEAVAKRVKQTQKVPGSPTSVSNLYEVSQALSWVATKRSNPEERLDWQLQIPDLVATLAKAGGSN